MTSPLRAELAAVDTELGFSPGEATAEDRIRRLRRVIEARDQQEAANRQARDDLRATRKRVRELLAENVVLTQGLERG